MFTIQIDDSQRASIERLGSSVAKASKTAVAERGIFNFALSGGNTANDIFEVLCASDIAWEKTRFFWVDERCVFPDDEASNYGQAKKNFFSKINAKDSNIFRLRGEECPVLECERYSRLVELLVKERSSGTPSFDCIILGIGADAHTASIFPHSMNILDDRRLYCANTDPSKRLWRMTMTGRTILAAKKILVGVYGKQKERALKSSVEGIAKRGRSSPAEYIISRARDIEIYTDINIL